jgi:hypothetical protein
LSFSGFTLVGGCAGIGLLLMRLACGGALLAQAVTPINDPPASETVVQHLLLIPVSIAILAGYRTRVAGSAAAGLEVWLFITSQGNTIDYALVATLGTALALLGPGCWSAEARLSGWRRIHIPGRRK